MIPSGRRALPRQVLALTLTFVILAMAPVPPARAGSFLEKLGTIIKVAYQADQIMWLLGDPAAERRFGFLFSRFVMLTNPLDRNQERNRWVRGIFDRVVEPSRRRGFEYRIFIVRDRSVNAFALPGGYVFVNRGMLDFVKSDDELAAVLGHELAHVNQRHALQMMRRNAALTILIDRAFKDGDNTTWAQISAIFMEMRFSRNNERECDRLGMQWARAAGYDPSGMATLWERMLKKYGDKRFVLDTWLSTHPGHMERVDNAKALLAQWGVPFRRTDFLTLDLRVSRPAPAAATGFDDGAPLWRLGPGATLDPTLGREGSGSLRLTNDGSLDACTLTGPEVALDPARTWTLSAAARSDGEGAALWLGLEFYDASHRPLGVVWSAAEGATPPVDDWVVYEGDTARDLEAARRPPQGAAFAAVVAVACRRTPGTVWLDDLVLGSEDQTAADDAEGPQAPPRTAPRPNLLTNGGFETPGRSKEQAKGWLLGASVSRTTERPASGEACLELRGERQERREFAIGDMVPVAEGGRYLLEAALRARPAAGVEFGYRLYDGKKKVLDDLTSLPVVRVSREGWTVVEQRLEIPWRKGARFLQVWIRARPGLGDRVWVDDVALMAADVGTAPPSSTPSPLLAP